MTRKDDLTHSEAFAEVVQRIALGEPVANLEGQGFNVRAYVSGVELTRGEEKITLDTSSRVLNTSGGQTVVLQSTNSTGETEAFKRQIQGTAIFGQKFEDDSGVIAAVVTKRNAAIFFGEDQGSALLVSHFDDGTRGIALYSDGILSAGEYNAPTPRQAYDRDFSPLLPAKV